MSLLTALALSRPTLGGFVLIGLVWGSVAAMLPELKLRIGASDGLLGALLFMSAIGVLSAMAIAPAADRRLGRWTVPLSATVLMLLFPLLGAATTPLAFALTLICLGLATGLTDVLINTRVSEAEARHARSLMNVNHAVFSFAYAAAAVAAGLGREAGLPPVLILAMPAALGLLIAPWLAVAPEPQGDGDGGAMPSGARGLVWLCGGIVLAGFMAEAAIEAWSALHVERTLGGGAAEGALGPATLGVTMGIGRLLGQALSDRLRDSRALLLGASLGAVGASVAALAPSPGVAYLGFALAGLGISVTGPLGLALVGRLAPRGHRSTAIARAAAIGFSGFFLASPMMGFVSELAGLRMSFLCVAVLLIAIWPLTAALRRLAPSV